MNSQRNPLLLIATALLLRLQGIWSVCSVSRCPGLHLDSAVFPLRQGKSLPEHCFPQTKKKPNVNTPEILKHCCLPYGSPCSGVWLYNALHRNEECTAAFNSLPVDSLHIFLQETQPFLYLFFPIPSMQQINILVITGCLHTVPFEAHCKHCTDIFVWIFIVVFPPDIFASFRILSGSFFPQLQLSFMGFCGGSDGKESACSSGDPGSILGWRRSPGEGNGFPLQCSCLGNLMNKGVW